MLKFKIFFERSIRRYIIFNMHDRSEHNKRLRRTPKNIIIFILQIFKSFLDFVFFRRVYMPYIEISITTKCSLKCKDCCNFIPQIDDKKSSAMSFGDYKTYIDNLLSSNNIIFNINLLGGEPLLNKDFPEILQYSLENKRIRLVIFTTNGTVLIPENITSILKQYREKVSVNLSNYTANKELKSVLKIEQIKKQLDDIGIRVNFNTDTQWIKPVEIKFYNRSYIENREYYLKCLHNCVHLLDGKLFCCPIAAATYALGYTQNGYFIDLSVPNKKILRKELFDFYSRVDFEECNYCNKLENSNNFVSPALQR